MRLAIYLVAAAALLGAAYLVLQVIVKRTYLRRGQLDAPAIALQLLIWLGFFLFPYFYNPGDWAWFWAHRHPIGRGMGAIAVILLLVGLAGLAVAVAQLGAVRFVGARAATLHASGLYRVTRNPQIVAGVPLIVGLALLRPTWFALGWVAIYCVMAHLMVLAEETHLRHRFGEAYHQYCAQVPRYLGR